MTAKKKSPEPEVVVVTTVTTTGGAVKRAGAKVKASQVPDLEWRLAAGIVVPVEDKEE